MQRTAIMLPAFFLALVFGACEDNESAAPGGPTGTASPSLERPTATPAPIAGVWRGDYKSDRGLPSGELCLELRQDGSRLSGEVVFDGSDAIPVGGRIRGDALFLVWGQSTREERDGTDEITDDLGIEVGRGLHDPPAEDDPLNYSFADGGSFLGTATETRASGGWASLNLDRGDWSAERVADERCQATNTGAFSGNRSAAVKAIRCC